MSAPGEDLSVGREAGSGMSSPSGADETRISGSYPFTAPAEVVFGVLTDPDRVSRWLPLGMNTESAGPEQVRVRVGSQVQEYRVQVVPERLQVRWRSQTIAGLSGTARVQDGPAGGSVVHAEVVLPDRTADDQRARSLLAETMRHLQRDVSDNFNAG
jgi:uncharacterized protein YndB with AHSA1/START domain